MQHSQSPMNAVASSMIADRILVPDNTHFGRFGSPPPEIEGRIEEAAN
jgi:hypothetical protein